MGAYATVITLRYVTNLVRSVDRRSAAARGIFDWLSNNPEMTGVEVVEAPHPRPPRPGERVRLTPSRLSRDLWTEIARLLAARRAKLAATKPDLLSRNLTEFATQYGLKPIDRDLLELACRQRTHRATGELFDYLLNPGALTPYELVAALIGASQLEVQRRLAPGAPLPARGLVEPVSDAQYRGPFWVSTALLAALCPPNRGLPAVIRALLGPPQTPALTWDDFDHVARPRDFARDLLKGAVAERARGINVLLWGPVGTGKTELARSLAQAAGLTLHAVGEQSGQTQVSGEPTRGERLAHLRIAQLLLAERQDAALLFDEFEDALRAGDPEGERAPAYSKLFVNRMLEGNRTPTLWTSNLARAADPAFLRRFTFAIEMRDPPPKVRARIWRRALGPLDEEGAADDLARRFHAPPAVAAGAVRAATLAGAGLEGVRLAAGAADRLMGRALPPDPAVPAARFALDLIACDTDLERLVSRLALPEAPRAVSFCLYGPPGSGKTEFARHLAERYGMPVLVRRASDLLRPYVGETEMQIADAFREAIEGESLLLMDEADGLLGDRTSAVRNWEVTQVNELLTWMEAHPLPFVATTNLMERLDQASLRRFTFKLRFDMLPPERAQEAFRRFFGAEPPSDGPWLAGLTPGDFAAVARRCRVLGITEPGEIAAQLAEEVQLKRGPKRPIGFRLAG